MTQSSDIISSLKGKLEMIDQLSSTIGSTFTASNNKRVKELTLIKNQMTSVIEHLELEVETEKRTITKLREDIQRVRDLLEGSITDYEGHNMATPLTTTKRKLLAQRNSMLQQYFSQLQYFLKESPNNHILQSKFNNILQNDFITMNKFVMDHFTELKYCEIKKPTSKPLLSINTISDSYATLSIHTPTKQIKSKTTVASTPVTKIYRTPQNSVTKKSQMSTISIRLTKIDTKKSSSTSYGSPFLFSETLNNPQTPLRKLLSPINMGFPKVSMEEEHNIVGSPMAIITPTRSAFKNVELARTETRKRRMNCKVTTGLIKFC